MASESGQRQRLDKPNLSSKTPPLLSLSGARAQRSIDLGYLAGLFARFMGADIGGTSNWGLRDGLSRRFRVRFARLETPGSLVDND
jgi:hypothetical protein